jgi:isoquinoline 1-oxidoreductase beta subunit
MGRFASIAWCARWICGAPGQSDVIRSDGGGIGSGCRQRSGAITLKDGAVERSVHDYVPLRIKKCLRRSAHLRRPKASGVGEPGTPVVAPAVANASGHAATESDCANCPSSEGVGASVI